MLLWVHRRHAEARTWGPIPWGWWSHRPHPPDIYPHVAGGQMGHARLRARGPLSSPLPCWLHSFGWSVG